MKSLWLKRSLLCMECEESLEVSLRRRHMRYNEEEAPVQPKVGMEDR